MDYVEFHRTTLEGYVQDLERQDHQWQWRKQCVCAILVLLTLLVATVLGPVVFRLIG